MTEAIYNHQNADPELTWSLLSILRSIANGYGTERRIRSNLRFARRALAQEMQDLRARGFIEQEGLFLRKWRLTPNGVNALGDYGYPPQSHATQNTIQRREIRHTTTFGTGFKLVFGALMAFLAAWFVIGAITSFAYWAGYNLLLKQLVPETIRQFIPFENPLVNVALGFITSTWLFSSLRHRMNLTSSIGR